MKIAILVSSLTFIRTFSSNSLAADLSAATGAKLAIASGLQENGDF
ncbi:MAG: hypothetical protein QNJ49_08550 [Mastigocoleus sp. MO_167.B18]|nr:hypothetical protein [Mastigocoleus sp. MO_167.B18]